MLRILGKRQSINVRKVLWACDEIGVRYLQEDWGTDSRPTSSAEFLALNPKGLVPVIIDGDTVLTESNTIVRYIAAKYDRTDLLPADPLRRAKVEEVMDWQATELNGSWRAAFLSLVRKNPATGTTEQISKSLTDWAAMMNLLNSRMSDGRSFVCGETFSVADIVIGVSVNRWMRAPIDRQELSFVNEYMVRIARRPAASPHIGEGTD